MLGTNCGWWLTIEHEGRREVRGPLFGDDAWVQARRHETDGARFKIERVEVLRDPARPGFLLLNHPDGVLELREPL